MRIRTLAPTLALAAVAALAPIAPASACDCPAGFTHRATAIKRFDAVPATTARALSHTYGHSPRWWRHTYWHIGPRAVTFRRLDGCTMRVHV